MNHPAPPVRRMVLFKHGVAFIERGGPCSGPFELSFKIDEMNDVLKSLAVWVASGDATVGAIAFEKPEDPQLELERRQLAFDPTSALTSALSALRGRRVRVRSESQSFEGEVIGLELSSGPHHESRRQLVLRTHAGELQLVAGDSIHTLELLEEPSRADLGFFVDRARAINAGENRAIGVTLEGKADDLRISYVVPAPTWRVTYRVVGEGDDTTLLGWAIVHNPVDQDLEGIDLTLTTGQPVSFVIDLYNPKNVQRAVVEEQRRGAAAPQHHERAKRAVSAAMAPRMAMPAPAPGAAYADEAAPMMASMGASLGDSMEGAASFEERGEHFEYRSSAKIAMRRGGSAMVPLFATKIRPQKERIWRVGSGASPDLVLSFSNDTGAVLEEGAAVVLDGGVYAGEAMVPYSARGTTVKLGYAKDLAVRCAHAERTAQVLTELRFVRNGCVRQLRVEVHHTLDLESDHSEEVRVIAELPKHAHRSFDPTAAQPFEETQTFYRFAAEIPAKSRTKLEIVERWSVHQDQQYQHLNRRELQRWFEQNLLDRQTLDKLQGVLGAYDEVKDSERALALLQQELQICFEKQKHITSQLQALRDTGPEGELRLRYVRELATLQDRVNAIGEEQRHTQQLAAAAQQKAEQSIAELARS